MGKLTCDINTSKEEKGGENEKTRKGKVMKRTERKRKGKNRENRMKLQT